MTNAMIGINIEREVSWNRRAKMAKLGIIVANE